MRGRVLGNARFCTSRARSISPSRQSAPEAGSAPAVAEYECFGKVPIVIGFVSLYRLTAWRPKMGTRLTKLYRVARALEYHVRASHTGPARHTRGAPGLA